MKISILKVSILKIFGMNCLCWMVIMCGVFGTGMASESFAASPLPEGLVMQDGFEPGTGKAVGQVSRVSGQVALIHKDGRNGYWAREGVNLFEDDTLITLADGQVAFRLADGSFVTLSPESRMVIAKSVYAPEKTTRTTFINMVKGKSRFVVKSFVEARRSEFKVKTATSVAGVRGSDFIIAATESTTEITTLADTELEVFSLAALDAAPVILKDFEQTTVPLGMPPGAVRKVQADEVDRLMREFKFHPVPGEHEPVTGQWPDASRSETFSGDGGLMVDREDLINPDADRFRTDMPRLTDNLKNRTSLLNDQEIRDKQILIFHQRFEDIKKNKLPDFPGTP
ncbi:MAG: FecR domain-containing protein [Desulfosalsimonadaceae bacterium]|nr:FecR domain-containing protein [Desulfosalsimonadaceae bacterium]